jgi:pimeloyl-ACP methyl ester carboxylesterase
MGYHFLDGIQYIRRVADHLGLAKVNLIGHSMGGGMSMLFAAVYPEHVSHLIMLDAIKPISRCQCYKTFFVICGWAK